VPETWELVFRTEHAQAHKHHGPSVASRIVILFPAIDIKDGACVRLEQGDMARATVFHRDPAAQALAFEALGFEFLHVVDLDGAFTGGPVNARAIDPLPHALALPVPPGARMR